MTKAGDQPNVPQLSRHLLLSELLLLLFLIAIRDFSDPTRLFAWFFGPLPQLPFADFFPWLSLTEGIRNLLLALVVGCLFLKERLSEVVRYTLAVCLVLGMCVMPVLAQIEIRHNIDEAPGNTSLYRSSSHDGGVLQVEMAAEALSRGENPYGMSYNRPPATRSRDSNPDGWRRLGYDANPALEHLSYPPGVLYVTAPFDRLSRKIFGSFDPRFIYLIAAFALAFVLASFVPSGPPRRMVVVATLANPLLVRYLANGRNDVLVLLALAVFAKTLLARRWSAAAAALGVALCMKQFALFVVPFFLIGAFHESNRRLGRTVRIVWPIIAVPMIVFLPFLVWDPVALINDVFLWTMGSGYPVRWDGYGLTPLAFGLGLVADPSGPNPFGVGNLLIMALAFFGLGIWVLRKPSPERILLASGALLYAALFTARSFAESYLAVPVLLWITLWFDKIFPSSNEKSQAPN